MLDIHKPNFEKHQLREEEESGRVKTERHRRQQETDLESGKTKMV